MTINKEPQIYVACLASYNEGQLHGEWIDATQDVELIELEIAEILADSPVKDAEEWAIHDYDGFGEASNILGEYPSLELVSKLARLIKDKGDVAIKLYLHCSDIDKAIQKFEDDYIGCYKDLGEYAKEFSRDTVGVPDYYQYYIDWDGMGDDLETNGDIISFQTSFEEIHIFHNY